MPHPSPTTLPTSLLTHPYKLLSLLIYLTLLAPSILLATLSAKSFRSFLAHTHPQHPLDILFHTTLLLTSSAPLAFFAGTTAGALYYALQRGKHAQYTARMRRRERRGYWLDPVDARAEESGVWKGEGRLVQGGVARTYAVAAPTRALGTRVVKRERAALKMLSWDDVQASRGDGGDGVRKPEPVMRRFM